MPVWDMTSCWHSSCHHFLKTGFHVSQSGYPAMGPPKTTRARVYLVTGFADEKDLSTKKAKWGDHLVVDMRVARKLVTLSGFGFSVPFRSKC